MISRKRNGFRIYSLSGAWKMKDTKGKKWKSAEVPGSVVSDLLRDEIIEDPFYRDNEDKAFALSYNDYEYTREFTVTGDILNYDRIVLCCEGLDTLAEIKINGENVAKTKNMHRTYELDIKGILKKGSNTIYILFYSPTRYIEKQRQENPLVNLPIGDLGEGYYYLRKAHSMFGWDWGPKIPDAGIWRNILLKCYNSARLDNVYVVQKQKREKVSLNIQLSCEIWTKEQLEIECTVIGLDNEKFTCIQQVNYTKPYCVGTIEIQDPLLWWPNGYGKQTLYKVCVALKEGNKILDFREMRIGIRTLKVRQSDDQWGRSFEFEVNGVSIFAKGANYIIEDNLMSRYSLERTERLIRDCVEAHFNIIRVWGGGIYPQDYFYDLCDQYGIIVWQDIMFACALSYPMTTDFIDSVKKEVADNVRRIRHHACLGLWCGNNEVEWIIYDYSSQPQFLANFKLSGVKPGELEAAKANYLKLFENIIPGVVKLNDPQTFYWPSSPSSGGSFDAPNDGNRGDVHYWDVWHSMKPFTDYRNHYFRFASEYGFQSFPCLKTVETFTLPEDRNVFSYIMEKHQKNASANGKILLYLSGTFKYPKDFDSLLYTSQLLQAEAIRYGVEHWRRYRGRCMGSIYWQLNDCWPVTSWSSIDYYGRWKALHYYAKRFYAPILISALDEDTKINIYVTNDTMNNIRGRIKWKLRDNVTRIIGEETSEIEIGALQAKRCIQLDFGEEINQSNRRKTYIEFAFAIDEQYISYGTVLFVKPKHFIFKDPRVKVYMDETEDQFILTLSSEAFAKSVELNLGNADCRFSDNYFDLSAGYIKKVEIDKSSFSENITIGDLKSQLRVRSLYDIEERK